MEKDRLNGKINVVLIGGSAGGLEVLFKLLPLLKRDLNVAVIIILHRRSTTDSSLAELLSSKTFLPLLEAEDKEMITAGKIFLAPSDYHLLIEKDFTFSLDYSEKVNFSRPSLDVTFESAADVYGSAATGVILSGANQDGTHGLQAMKKAGGAIIAQQPSTAQMPLMPQYAIDHLEVDYVFSTAAEIAGYINDL